jgi:hypothetical protein
MNGAVRVLGHYGLLLFGGCSTSPCGGLQDTWNWDGTTWTELSPTTSPPPRADAVAGTVAGQVVLFGGLDSVANPGLLGDTWTWDGSTWNQENVSGPSPREGAVMGCL